MKRSILLASLILISKITLLCAADGAPPADAAPAAKERSPETAWKNGPPADPNYFPIAVWLQDPKNAAKYKAAGINLYVALWKGPTKAQIDQLREAGMAVICSQGRGALSLKDDPTIVGWMHGDEPDNAQEIPGRKGYGPPVLPEK